MNLNTHTNVFDGQFNNKITIKIGLGTLIINAGCSLFEISSEREKKNKSY